MMLLSFTPMPDGDKLGKVVIVGSDEGTSETETVGVLLGNKLGCVVGREVRSYEG